MSTRRSSEHTLELADHLWEVLEQAAFEMGADPSFLVNQALFAWAVQHGYLQPGSLPRPQQPVRAVAAVAAPPPLKQPPPQRAPPPPPKVAPTHFPKKETRPKSPAPPTQVNPAFVPTKREPDPPPVPEELPQPSQSLLDYLPGEAPMGEEGELDSTAVIDLRGKKPERTIVGRPDRRLFAHIEGRDVVEVPRGKFIIGRDENCDLPLISSRISRHHAQVMREAGGVTIEDLGSSNGTWFGDERITKRGIEHGDEFVIGDYVVRFEYE